MVGGKTYLSRGHTYLWGDEHTLVWGGEHTVAGLQINCGGGDDHHTLVGGGTKIHLHMP